MSIAKNTQRRKKVAQQNVRTASKAKTPATRPPASQKAAEPLNWNDLRDEVYRLLRSLTVAQRLAYAALFHAAMMKLQAAWRQPSAKRQRVIAAFIRELEQESRNRRYRRIMRALAAATEESVEEMKRAYQTAHLAVQIVLEWSTDYRFIFGDYQPKHRPARPRGRKAPAAR